jgi:hypothetical protein
MLLKLSIISLVLLNYNYCFAESKFEEEIRSFLFSNELKNIEYIGPGLSKELSNRKTIFNSCSFSEIKGDAEPPIGNNKASTRLIINCNNFRALGIRFGKSSSGKFKVFGFWSLTETDKSK